MKNFLQLLWAALWLVPAFIVGLILCLAIYAVLPGVLHLQRALKRFLSRP